MATNKSGYGTIQTILRRIPGIALHLLFPPRTTLHHRNDWGVRPRQVLQKAILTKFNPLKFCDETVVYIFAKLATKLNVCYCYSIIEHNKRERMLHTNALPSAVGNFKQKQEFLDLEAYFPFDPLVLPISKSIVAPNYIEWSEDTHAEETDSEDDI